MRGLCVNKTRRHVHPRDEQLTIVHDQLSKAFVACVIAFFRFHNESNREGETIANIVSRMDLDKLKVFRSTLGEPPVIQGREAHGIWAVHSGRSTIHIGSYEQGDDSNHQIVITRAFPAHSAASARAANLAGPGRRRAHR